MNKTELICEITHQIVEEKFGEFTQNQSNPEVYTDDAQDFFNERYDEIEFLLNTFLKKENKQ